MARLGGDSEKITVNLGFMDLGAIDLLVKETVYCNRTEFIRSAIRAQLERHSDFTSQITVREKLVLGINHFTRVELERVREAEEMLEIRVLGLASFASDISAELALETVRSIKVLGAFHAPAEIKSALADRIV